MMPSKENPICVTHAVGFDPHTLDNGYVKQALYLRFDAPDKCCIVFADGTSQDASYTKWVDAEHYINTGHWKVCTHDEAKSHLPGTSQLTSLSTVAQLYNHAAIAPGEVLEALAPVLQRLKIEVLT